MKLCVPAVFCSLVHLVKRIRRRVAIVHNSVILSIERAGVRAPTRENTS